MKTKIIFDFKENIKAKKSRLDIFFNNLKISRATKILPNNDLDIFLKINNKNYKIKNPMSENIIYNHNKLLKNDKLLFDYNVNSNIILLVKKFLLDENRCSVILAGGLGTRMGKLTKNSPKTLIKVKGKPIFWYIINELLKNNFDKIIITLGYKGKK